MSSGEAQLPLSGSVGFQTRRTARNAVARGSAEVVGKASTLAWTLVAARSLDQQQFGAFAFALSFSVLLASLPQWGFPAALLQRGSREPGRVAALHSSALAWQIGLAVPVLVVGVVVAGLFRPSGQAKAALGLVAAAVLLDMWSDTCRTTAAVLQRQTATSTALALQRIATAVAVIGALAAGFGIVGMGAGMLAGSAFGAVAHSVALRRLGVGIDVAAIDRAGLVRFFRDARVVGVSALVLMALFRIDAVLISVFHDDSEVAVYAAAYRLLETVLFITWAINSAMAPVISSASGDPETVRRGLTAEFTAATAIYLPFAAVLLTAAEPLLRLLFGEAYANDSAPALRWLALSPVCYAFAFFGHHALYALGKERVVLVASTAALAVNVALNLVLVPTYAGTGAAAATTLSYLSLSIFLVVRLRPCLGALHLARTALEPAAGALVLVATVLTLRLPLLVEVPIGLLLYVVTWVTLVRRRDPDQLRVIRSVLPGQRT